jgi:CubicO group peptidase (beta-lactamase class C family)
MSVEPFISSQAYPRPVGLRFDKGRLTRIQDWMQRYVDAGKLPFAATVISHHNEIAWHGHTGLRDVASATPYDFDTIVRIYSMTKPVTAVGLMMLYEKGLFHLDDPVEEFLPEFSKPTVLRKKAKKLGHTKRCKTTPTIHHLLTHTAGLTYGFNGGLIGDVHETRKLDFAPGGPGLAETVKQVAALPLQFEPGSQWHYSVASDVLGRLIEVTSGQPLDTYIHENILEPLGMKDTAFDVPEDKQDRLASLYKDDGKGGMVCIETAGDSAYHAGKVKTFSGGGGLLSTAGDYLIFAEMLRLGGAFEDVRLLSPRTLQFMTTNHLPGDLASMGPQTWCETSFSGIGFGLGFSVTMDPAKAQMPGSTGDFGWGGMASTVFWVDPLEDFTVLFLTQLLPSSTYPLRKELRALVYQAMVD